MLRLQLRSRPWYPLRADVRLACAAGACYNRNRQFWALGVSSTQIRWSTSEENSMKNPLDSLWGTVISGLILTLILYFVVKCIL